MSTPESTPTHLPRATLCHSRLYPPSQGLWIWPLGVVIPRTVYIAAQYSNRSLCYQLFYLPQNIYFRNPSLPSSPLPVTIPSSCLWTCSLCTLWVKNVVLYNKKYQITRNLSERTVFIENYEEARNRFFIRSIKVIWVLGLLLSYRYWPMRNEMRLTEVSIGLPLTIHDDIFIQIHSFQTPSSERPKQYSEPCFYNFITIIVCKKGINIGLRLFLKSGVVCLPRWQRKR